MEQVSRMELRQSGEGPLVIHRDDDRYIHFLLITQVGTARGCRLRQYWIYISGERIPVSQRSLIK